MWKMDVSAVLLSAGDDVFEHDVMMCTLTNLYSCHHVSHVMCCQQQAAFHYLKSRILPFSLSVLYAYDAAEMQPMMMKMVMTDVMEKSWQHLMAELSRGRERFSKCKKTSSVVAAPSSFFSLPYYT
jgi:hypothetical protein